jgi:polar amino acid transport system permease protein
MAQQPTATSGQRAGGDADRIVAIPARHYGRWVATVVVVLLGVLVVNSMATNPRFQWGVVRHYMTWPSVLRGIEATIELTILSMLIGIVLGVVLAVMRLSPNPIVSGGAWLYIWFFRGSPLIVQIVLWYNIAALYPTMSLSVPSWLGGFTLATGNANTLITLFVAALLGLGLNEGAYMSEIVRAGIISVDEGQTQAAQAIGMTRLQTMRRIVLPQAMRVIIPPTGNEFISMLKNTALASVIAYTELFYAVQLIYSRTYQTIPLLLVATIWYLIMTSVLTVIQFYIERHFARGSIRSLPDTPLMRLRKNLVHARIVTRRGQSA